jgi:hypothetical protein
MVLITEEIARVHSAMRVAINMQIGPALTLLQFGTEEQKKKFIPGLVSGDTIGCFAITEPDAGSDVAALRTTARKDGDQYLLNGSKLWISNGPVTNGGLVYAYTDRSQKHRGMSAFYTDWNQPGLTRRTLETLGAHCSPLGELTFDNFRIPRRTDWAAKAMVSKSACATQSNAAELRGRRIRRRARRRRPPLTIATSASVRSKDRRVSNESGFDRADDRS